MRFLFLAFLLLGACGEYKKTKALLGEEISFNPVVVQGDELNRLTRLCTALTQKAALLGAGSTEVVKYSLATKSCDEANLGDPVDVNLNLEVFSGNFLLRRTDNNALFIYPDVETNQSGVMKEICPGLGTLTNPKKLSNGNILRFTTSTSSECLPASNEICIQLETGTPSDGKFKITTREWIKFQVDPTLSRLGFFNQRTTESISVCTEDKFTLTHAVLK